MELHEETFTQDSVANVAQTVVQIDIYLTYTVITARLRDLVLWENMERKKVALQIGARYALGVLSSACSVTW